jgi:hypothetical protein
MGGAGPLDPEACRRLACDGTPTRVLISRQPDLTGHHSGSDHDPGAEHGPNGDQGLAAGHGLAAGDGGLATDPDTDGRYTAIPTHQRHRGAA